MGLATRSSVGGFNDAARWIHASRPSSKMTTVPIHVLAVLLNILLFDKVAEDSQATRS